MAFYRAGKAHSICDQNGPLEDPFVWNIYILPGSSYSATIYMKQIRLTYQALFAWKV